MSKVRNFISNYINSTRGSFTLYPDITSKKVDKNTFYLGNYEDNTAGSILSKINFSIRRINDNLFLDPNGQIGIYCKDKIDLENSSEFLYHFDYNATPYGNPEVLYHYTNLSAKYQIPE